ncbi:hypothetical protein ABIF91_003475 [Bradyrhizobium sp. USDA 241]
MLKNRQLVLQPRSYSEFHDDKPGDHSPGFFYSYLPLLNEARDGSDEENKLSIRLKSSKPFHLPS